MEINHIGLTVPDVDAAVGFYCAVFGMQVLVAPQLHNSVTRFAARRKDVFGARWGAMKLAHLVTPSGCGFELFEFVDPPTVGSERAFDYARVGVSHLCLTSDDFDADLARLMVQGGRKRSGVHTVQEGVRICYCEDPWGNVIEIASAAYSRIVLPASDPQQ